METPAFSRFNNFPWEIRRMVWEEALSPTVPQVLTYKASTFPRWDHTANTWGADDGPPWIPIPPPALLHTNAEARAFALEHVRIRTEKKLPTRSRAPNSYHRMVTRAFDRDIDALFVHETHFRAFMGVYMRRTPFAARHLIFDSDLFAPRRDWYDLWDHFVGEAAERCRGLRSVTLADLSRCAGALDARAFGDCTARGYYRIVTDVEAAGRYKRLGEELRQQFEGLMGPDGVPWKVEVRGASSCGTDEEGILECSQVLVEGFTASSAR